MERESIISILERRSFPQNQILKEITLKTIKDSERKRNRFSLRKSIKNSRCSRLLRTSMQKESTAMTTKSTITHDEAQIRQFIVDQKSAICAKDFDRIMATEGIVFDVKSNVPGT